MKEACDLIKPIIHARCLLYPFMSAHKNPAMYVVCAVSDKCDLCCVNVLNRNSKNAERNLSSDPLLLLLLFVLFRRTHDFGARGGVVVKALRYKPAGRGFDSR